MFHCISAPLYKVGVLVHSLKAQQSFTNVHDSHFLITSWIIDLYSCFLLLGPAHTTQVTHYCTVVLFLLSVLFLLLFLSQLLLMAGKMNKLQKPQRYSSLAAHWIYYIWLFWFDLTEIQMYLFFVCTYRLQLTCRSFAHQGPPYPHHCQVQSTLSLYHLNWTD